MSERIPFPRSLSRKSCDDIAGHEARYKKGSGIWVCTLEVRTPLCINKEFARQQGERRPPRIPGSSLRGMVRNVVEILGASCAQYHEGGGGYAEELLPCGRRAACIACRSFGFVNKDYAWTGKLKFSDAPVVPSPAFAWQNCRIDPAVGTRPPAGEKGWIVFPHFVPVAADLRNGRMTAVCAPVGTRFRFRVQYLNLDDEEFAVVRFALSLKDERRRLYHKLGYAKSVGLGSCVVTIENDRAEDQATSGRYLDQEALRRFAECRSD